MCLELRKRGCSVYHKVQTFLATVSNARRVIRYLCTESSSIRKDSIMPSISCGLQSDLFPWPWVKCLVFFG